MNKNKIIKRSLIFIIVILVIILSVITGFYSTIRNNMYIHNKNLLEDISHEEITTRDGQEEITNIPEEKEPREEEVYKYEKGLTNILLIGLDERTLDEDCRSDSMIILTIDEENKKLKLTSIMRDSYLNIPGYGMNKVNAAFFLGGMPLLAKTLYYNFGIKIDNYIAVNFWGFENIIDTLGGITVDVKDYEITEMNKFIGEYHEKKSPPIVKPGIQQLDGQQSLAYSRIRKVGDGSYERNKRQREVLSKLANKINEISLTKYPKLMEELSSCIKTNVEPIKLMNYGFTISKIKPLNIEELQIPVTELSLGGMYKGSWVLLMDIAQNKRILNSFIFENKTIEKQDYDYYKFQKAINQYKSSENSGK